MKNLILKRQILLYKQIYEFNDLISVFAHKSYLKDLEVISHEIIQDKKQYTILNNNYLSLQLTKKYINHYYYEINDVWLRFISMRFNKLFMILDEVMLILILQNPGAKISGKLLKALNQYYKGYMINKAIIHNNENNSPLINVALLEIDLFKVKSIYIILNMLYQDKHVAMKERLILLFEKNLIIEDEIELFWKQFDINNISSIILNVFDKLQVHIKNIETI